MFKKLSFFLFFKLSFLLGIVFGLDKKLWRNKRDNNKNSEEDHSLWIFVCEEKFELDRTHDGIKTIDT